jgi:hypothetical protein
MAARRGEGKTRGRPAREPEPPRPGKVTLRLGGELARRLAVVAAARCITQSELVVELLEPYLRRWRIPNAPDAPATDSTEVLPSAPRLAL